MKTVSFKKWLFEKKDVDTLIIALILSTASTNFIKDFSTGIINPIIESIIPSKNKDMVQTLNIYDFIVINFKLQVVITGFINLCFNFLLAYLIVTYIFKLADIN